MRTQVGIVGGGPAGLLLSHLLALNGIDSIVLERRSRGHVLSRIRAGLLEAGSVELLRGAGLGVRMDREGIAHDGSEVVWGEGKSFLIDTRKFTGKPMMAYGQTAITEDLYRARETAGGLIIDEADDVRPQDLISDRPFIGFTRHGKDNRIDCDFVAGCDGYHGVCRQTIPPVALTIHEKAYPFGWLGIMSDTPPLPHLVYAYSERGFALASMRGSNRSRYYVQCSLDTNLDEWTDDRFWEELKARYPKSVADSIVIGPAIEKTIAPLRSFVAEPMRYGRLFLAGDAAHVVPPTGAKGLNLAFSDVFYLSRALAAHYKTRDDDYLERYSEMALRRAWNAIRLSWRLTHLLHKFPDESSLDLRMRENELEYLAASGSALASLAEQYVGLPFEN